MTPWIFAHMRLQDAVLFARRVDDPADLACRIHPRFNSDGLAGYLRAIAVTLGPVEGTSELVARIQRAAEQLDNGDDVTAIVDGQMTPTLSMESLLYAQQRVDEREVLLQVWPRIVGSLGTNTGFLGAHPLDLHPDQMLQALRNPANRGHFARVLSLDVSGLHLNRLFPGIENFTGLHTLDLSKNRFDKIPRLSPSIRTLILSGNQIRTIPDEIEPLAKILYLDLNNNLIENLPDSFRLLGDLRQLCLSGNRFQTIPLALLALTQLVALDISGNQLERVPDEIGGLNKLQLLNLKSNRILYLPPTIRSLPELCTLDLSDNPIPWPSEAIADFAVITGLPFTQTLTVSYETQSPIQLFLQGTGYCFAGGPGYLSLERIGPSLWRKRLYAIELRSFLGRECTYKVTQCFGVHSRWETGPSRIWRAGNQEMITPEFD